MASNTFKWAQQVAMPNFAPSNALYAAASEQVAEGIGGVGNVLTQIKEREDAVNLLKQQAYQKSPQHFNDIVSSMAQRGYGLQSPETKAVLYAQGFGSMEGSAKPDFGTVETAEGVYAYDKSTGQRGELLGGVGQKQPVASQYQVVEGTDPQGNAVFAQVDKVSGQVTPLQGVVPAPSATQAKTQVTQESLSSQYTGLTDSINLVNSLVADPNLGGATGINALLPTIAGSSSAGIEAKVETLKSQQFLAGVEQMKGLGALTDAEGKRIESEVATLNLNQSDEDFKESLEVIQRTLLRGQNKVAQQMKAKGFEVPQVEDIYNPSLTPRVENVATQPRKRFF